MTRATGWMAGAAVALVALATGCLQSEPATWGRSETLELGTAYVDEWEPKPFGFRAELDVPEGLDPASEEMELYVQVDTLADWLDWDDTESPTGVWSALAPCAPDGGAWQPEDLSPFRAKILKVNCPVNEERRWMVVLAQDDPATLGASGLIRVQPTAHLRVSGPGDGAPEGFALGELIPEPVWHRMWFGLVGPQLPSGAQRVEGGDVEVTVRTGEPVLVAVVATGSVSWDETASEAPRVGLELVTGGGASLLDWPAPMVLDGSYVGSAPLEGSALAMASPGDFSLRVVATSETPVPVDVQTHAHVEIHVFGFGEEPPDDLVFDMTPLHGGDGW